MINDMMYFLPQLFSFLPLSNFSDIGGPHLVSSQSSFVRRTVGTENVTSHKINVMLVVTEVDVFCFVFFLDKSLPFLL